MADFSNTFALTQTQQDIYLDQLFRAGTPAYNVGGYIELSRLDFEKLTSAHAALISEYDAFGIRIIEQEGQTQQWITSERNTALPQLDFSNNSDPVQAADLWLKDLFESTIEVQNYELFKAYLLKLSDHKYRYVGCAHHLCLDGWGFANWAEALSRKYHGQTPLAGLAHWREAVIRETDYLAGERFNRDQQFWQEYLQQVPDKLFSPVYSQNNHFSPSKRKVITVSPQWHQRFATLAKEQGFTLAHFYMGVLCAYFSLSQDSEQLILGLPVHNRSNKAEKNTIGVFTSVSPILVDCPANDSFFALCRHIASGQKRNYRHQKYPISKIIKELNQHGTGEQLHQLAFNYLKLNSDLTFEDKPVRLEYLSHNHETTPFSLTLWESGYKPVVELQIDYNLAYFNDTEIEAIAARLQLILAQLYKGEVKKLNHLKTMTPAEQAQLMAWGQGAQLSFPKQTLNQLIEQQARQKPNATAIIFEDQSLSYRQLNEKANQLARNLQIRGVKPQDYVGISLERSELMIVAVLAILKAGAAYVPLDPNYPKQRLEFIIADTKIEVLLTQVSLAETLRVNQEVHIDDTSSYAHFGTENLTQDYSPEHPAYVIYTSGSTGNPKGVCIRHRNAVAMLYWAKMTYSDEELSHVLVSTSLNFDLSVFEIFTPLCFGYCAVVVQNAISLAEKPVNVSLINTVPSAIKALLDANALPLSAKVVNLAGEPLKASIVNSLLQTLPGCKVFNLYGPSEDTTYSTFAQFEAPLDQEPVIGKVLPGSQALVLSKHQKLLPPCATGELCLAGDGVAVGYLNRDDLTQEKFISNPYGAGVMYRTGDLVRYLENGELAYISRVDEQVKIRGFRVEPSEIEHQLLASGLLSACVVVAETIDHHHRLIAYVCATKSKQTDLIEQLKSHLNSLLPEHMLPTVYMELDTLPLTPNGKVNKRALPKPEFEVSACEVQPPESESEKSLALIWSDILGLDLTLISTSSDFFSLGGDSLLALKLVAEIKHSFNKSVSIKEIFTHRKLSEQAHLLMHAGHAINELTLRPLSEQQRQASSLSYAQKGLWFLDRFNGGSIEYNMPAAFRIDGVLDNNAAALAAKSLVIQHRILRTVYHEKNGSPVQICMPPDIFELEQHEVPSNQDAERFVTNWVRRPFDLSQDSMLRVCYLKQTSESGWLLFNLHHIASDGWSVKLLIEQFSKHYQLFTLNPDYRSYEDILQYTDYSEWQKLRLSDDRLEQLKKFWQTQLADAPAIHGIPTYSGSPQETGTQSEVLQGLIDGNTLHQLENAATKSQLTLFMLLHASLALVVSHHSDNHDIIIGTPVANRPESELAQMMGCFVNAITLRTDTAKNSVSAFLDHVKEVNLAALSHQEMPFDLLVEQLHIQRTTNHAPLFQILLTISEEQQLQLQLPGLSLHPIDLQAAPCKFDIEVNVSKTPTGLVINWLYNSSLFSQQRIADMNKHFCNILEALGPVIIQNQSLAICQLPMLDDTETKALLTASKGPHYVSGSLLIHQLFEHQTVLYPQRIAVRHEDQTLSYQQLECEANKLASYLRSIGIGPEKTVGVSLTRTPTMIISLMGILKAGGAYVPMDPAYPSERLKYIARDANLSVLLTERAAQMDHDFEGVDVVLELDDQKFQSLMDNSISLPEKDSNLQPEHLAYIIYTSGSTGQPKGVEISHGNAVAMLQWSGRTFDKDTFRSVLVSTSLNFDLSVFEIFAPLSHGGTCSLVDNALALVENPKLDISLINTVPSVAKTLLAEGAIPETVKVINLAGEPLTSQVVNGLLENRYCEAVYNLYGPSEDTTYSTVQCYRAPIHFEPRIGIPVHNTSAYIISATGHLAPNGTAGELWLSGDCVARGYRNRPEMSKERFISDPFVAPSKQKLYRTGDWVRREANGELTFLGRQDAQIKLRGFRIELGEIESALRQLTGIKDAIVKVFELANSNQQMVAFYTLQENTKAVKQLNLEQQLAKRLPHYMLPDSYQKLTEFTLTANGKIDRKALSLPKKPDNSEYHKPKNKTQQTLLEIWTQLLSLSAEQISIDSNFFSLGGNSLLAVRLVSEIRQQMCREVPVKTLFKHSTIRALDNWLASHEDEYSQQPVIPLVRDGSHYPLSSAQHRLWLQNQLDPTNNEYNMYAAFEVDGEFEPVLAQRALEAIVNRHEILRTRFFDVDGVPRQEVVQDSDLQLEILSLTHLSGAAQERQLTQLLTEKTAMCFDLYKATQLKACFIALSQNRGVLFFNIHHIISDGQSIALLCSEFAREYQCLRHQSETKYPPLPVQYIDYLMWDQSRRTPTADEKALSYWTALLAGAPARHGLMPDQNVEHLSDNSGHVLLQPVSVSLSRQLRDFQQQYNVTQFMLVQTALAVHIGRYSAEQDIVLGAPVSGRVSKELEPLIGLFLNTQVYRIEFADNPNFAVLAKRVRQQHINSAQHNYLPFDELVDAINPVRSGAHTPLFQIMVNQDDLQLNQLTLTDCKFTAIENEKTESKYDLTLYIQRSDNQQLQLKWVYKSKLYSEQFMQHFTEEFSQLLTNLVCHAHKPVLDHPWYTELPATECKPLKSDSINPVTLFEQQVTKNPNALALSFENSHFSYAQLNVAVNQFADYLSKTHQVSPGSKVALACQRTDQRIVHILALLKLGACYIPLSDELNARRLQTMLQISAPDLILIDQHWQHKHHWLTEDDDNAVLLITEQNVLNSISNSSTSNPPIAPLDAKSSAHIIFTSGSTGTPKAVEGTYLATWNRVRWMLDEMPFAEGEACIHITSMAFIRGIWEMLVPLCGGVSLHLCPRDKVREVSSLMALMIERKISRIVTAPSLLKAIADFPKLQLANLHLKYWFVSGEPLPANYARSLIGQLPDLRLINLYGSTEVMSDVSWHRVILAQNTRDIPIGKPISGVQVVILDSTGQRVPTNGVGEIVVTGNALARGYLNDKTNTQEKFVETPYGRGYRTGDLGRLTKDGLLMCHGRMDDQIKIRGYRIEPGEILNHIVSLQQVESGCVIVRPHNAQNPKLLAYIVPTQWPDDSTEFIANISQQLTAILPDYMMPAAIGLVQSLPQLPNGKVNKKALPDIDSGIDSEHLVAPATDTEEVLVHIVASVLKVAQSEIGVTHSFFALGGHSLLAGQLMKRIEDHFGFALSYQEFFKENNIRHIAAQIDAAATVRSVMARHHDSKNTTKNKIIL